EIRWYRARAKEAPICAGYVHRICPYISAAGTNLPSRLRGPSAPSEGTPRMHRRSLLSGLATVAVSVLAPRLANAQARPGGYPTRPVTIVVPFTAGQSGDVLARVLAEPLAKLWGQSLLVDNKGGAGGTLGSRAAAAAPADG